MLDNVSGPISSLQAVTNQASQFKSQKGTALTYEKYSGLFLSDKTNLNNKFNWDTKFGSKYHRSFYELEQFPNDGDDDSFDIDYSVHMVQA